MDEKTYTDDNTRLWRTQAVVHIINDEEALTEFRFENPIPVYSSDRIVGAASLEVRGRIVHADLFIDYGIPERLDVEAGMKVWALPRATSTSFIRAKTTDGANINIPTITTFDSLSLRCDGDFDLPSIGAAL